MARTGIAVGVLLGMLGLLAPRVGEAARLEQTLIKTSPTVIWSADMAYDSTTDRLLIVWVNGEPKKGSTVPAAGIYGRAFSIDRTANKIVPDGGQFAISFGSGHYFPRVAGGDGVFLVSYGRVSGNGNGIQREVRLVDLSAGSWGPTPGPRERGTILDSKVSRGVGGVEFVPASGGGEAHFLATWTKSGVSYMTNVFLDGVNTTEIQQLSVAGKCGMAVPEVAVNQFTGLAFVVGFRDPTSDVCKGQSGLWYRYVDGVAPSGQMDYVVEGSTTAGLHWEQKVAFGTDGPGQGRFQVAWTRKLKKAPGIYGRGFDNVGPVETTPYALQGPIKGPPIGDDKFGQNGIGYDFVTDRFIMAMRGKDPGNGVAPVFERELTPDGAPVDATFRTLSSNLAPAPWPVVKSDGQGYTVVMYRATWGKINAVLKW